MRRILISLFALVGAFSVPAHATFGRMHQAIDKLVAAQSAPFASKAQVDDINSALEHLHQAFTKDAQKDRAISFAEAARADAQAKDADKFKSDISAAIAAANAVVGGDAAPQPAVPSSPAVTASPAVVAPVSLSPDQAHALVLIKGDNAEGTGFLAKVNNAPVVFTNQHVLADNPNIKITTCTGAAVEVVSYKGATDRDVAMIAVKDVGFNYLALAPDLAAVATGDDAITPGNSEGGEVMLNTGGKVLGIGPDRVEVSNPIYHGNSGGPVVDGKTHQVIAVVAMAIKVDNADALDKASFASRDSAIRGSMRYFGLRVDNVPTWEDLDWKNFQSETAFLDKFDMRSRCLDSFLNSPTPAATANSPEKKKKKKQKQDAAPTPAPAPADNSDLANLWLQDPALVKANNQFDDQTSGSADTAQQLDALRELLGNIVYAANADMSAVQSANNFYSYDRARAKEELAYRQALLDELNRISSNIDRLGHLPRTNN